MKKVMMGNHAVSYAVMLSRVKVIAAYPITPQTQVVEMLSELCADGDLDAKFIKVESEHSAMACIVGASCAGVRAFTATASHGLALMHEMLHWASMARMPLVMANANRALGPGWNIWADQSDSLSQRDTGWLQIYCENNQEVLDTTLQAYRIAEQVKLPVMLAYDAFFLSHTSEPVDVPTQEEVDAFLPAYEPSYKLDVANPFSFGPLTSPDHYLELRYRQMLAMEDALGVAEEVFADFKEKFGRSYGLIEPYRMEDAETVMVTAGTLVSTAQEVVDELREQGQKVGLLKLRVFRPFPVAQVREALKNARKVVVLERNCSLGIGGIFSQEVRAALYGMAGGPPLWCFIAGLGGRDVTPEIIELAFSKVTGEDAPREQYSWLGIKGALRGEEEASPREEARP